MDADELLPSDEKILDVLQERGNCTPAALIDWTDLSGDTVHGRLNVLRAAEHVEKIHESGLYQLVSDPRWESAALRFPSIESEMIEAASVPVRIKRESTPAGPRFIVKHIEEAADTFGKNRFKSEDRDLVQDLIQKESRPGLVKFGLHEEYQVGIARLCWKSIRGDNYTVEDLVLSDNVEGVTDESN